MLDARLSILIFLLLPYFAAAQADYIHNDTIHLNLDSRGQSKANIRPWDTYALARDVNIPQTLSNTPLEVLAGAELQFAKGQKAWLVLTLMAADTLRYWHAMKLEPADSTGTAKARAHIFLPPDYLQEASLRVYFWNTDSADFEVVKGDVLIRPHSFPHLLPSVYESSTQGVTNLLFQNERFELHYNPTNGQIVLADVRGRPLSGPFQWLIELIRGSDTLSWYTDQWKLRGRFFEQGKILARLVAINPYQKVHIRLSTDSFQGLKIDLKSRFRRKTKVLRQALVVPLAERPEYAIDDKALMSQTGNSKSYYLGQGGFVSGKNERRLSLLQSRHLAGIQLDMNPARLVANLSYAHAHPLIHYPKDESRQDYFEDQSSPILKKRQELEGYFALWPGQGNIHMPRLMPLPYGAEGSVVWTEHADWTDLRTHRAVHFGCDTIKSPEKAVGGFDRYGIPVSKSVFYHNPGQITNKKASEGHFPGLHASLADSAFRTFIGQIYAKGHEIGLHTPEQHSSTRQWMKEALSFTRNHYQSAFWIDHGYSNHPNANRENMVGDGLIKGIRHYSADLWRKYGVRYLWNAAPEELRTFEQYAFDGNFIIPYPGFGPLLPQPVFSKHPSAQGFLLWNTTGTLEMPTDGLWDYTFSPARLERLMQYHSIWINHVYPAWTLPGKGFWTYDADSNLVAMPGFNRALETLSKLQESGRLLNTTISRLASYHQAIENVELIPIDDHQMLVINHNPYPIEALSFVTTSEKVLVEGKSFQSRRRGNNTYFWFDLKEGEMVKLRY